MFKFPGKSTPVAPTRPSPANAPSRTAATNTEQPDQLNFATLPAREQGLECLPMEAWHESELPQRLGAQPRAIAEKIAGFLGDRDLNSFARTARQFQEIPASVPGFVAKSQLEQVEQQFKDLKNESKRLETKLKLLIDLASPDTSDKIRALKSLGPNASRSDIAPTRARLTQIDADMDLLKLKRHDILGKMKAAGATVRPAPETKAVTETSGPSSTASSSFAQTMPMRPDQWELRHKK